VDALHCGSQQRGVRSGTVFDAVVEDDAVVVVGDLGFVAELDRLVDASLADRPGVRIVQADQAGSTSTLASSSGSRSTSSGSNDSHNDT
jgi:hypothetical protein